MENYNVMPLCENFIFVLKYCVVYRCVAKSEIMQKFSMTSTEVDEVVDWLIKNNYIEVDGESLSSKITFPQFCKYYGNIRVPLDIIEIDSNYLLALRFCIEVNKVHAVMIMLFMGRKLHRAVGYIKAYQIVDWMEFKGYICRDDDNGHRRVTLSKEEFERLYGKIDLGIE